MRLRAGARYPVRALASWGVVVLLLGADSADEQGSSESPPEPPTVVARAIEPGDEVLERAVDELKAGRYQGALEVAIPALSQYPELEPSFRAVVDVAAQQAELERMAEQGLGYPVAPYYAPRDRGRRTLWGLDVGMPTALRVEFVVDRKTMDSWGLRIGATGLIYGGFYAAGDMSLFMDFPVAEQWDIEAITGLAIYSGIHPQAGVAAQYDPDGPIHFNVGARVMTYGVMPELAVGWVW